MSILVTAREFLGKRTDVLNAQQKKTLRNWPRLLWVFTKREWLPLFLSCGVGIVAAGVVHLVWQDDTFQSFLFSKYDSSIHIGDLGLYSGYFIVISVLVVLALAWPVASFFRKGLSSWREGATSGLILLGFLATLFSAALPSHLVRQRVVTGITIVGASFLASFLLFLKAKIHAERTILESECTVSPSLKSLSGPGGVSNRAIGRSTDSSPDA